MMDRSCPTLVRHASDMLRGARARAQPPVGASRGHHRGGRRRHGLPERDRSVVGAVNGRRRDHDEFTRRALAQAHWSMSLACLTRVGQDLSIMVPPSWQGALHSRPPALFLVRPAPSFGHSQPRPHSDRAQADHDGGAYHGDGHGSPPRAAAPAPPGPRPPPPRPRYTTAPLSRPRAMRPRSQGMTRARRRLGGGWGGRGGVVRGVGGGHGSGRPVGVHCDGRPQHRGVLVPVPARVSSGRLLHDIELGDGQAQVGLYLLQRPSQGDRAGIPFAGGLGHRCDQDPSTPWPRPSTRCWRDAHPTSMSQGPTATTSSR